MGEAGVGGHRAPFVMETGVVKLPKSSVPSSSRPSLFSVNHQQATTRPDPAAGLLEAVA